MSEDTYYIIIVIYIYSQFAGYLLVQYLPNEFRHLLEKAIEFDTVDE